MGMSPRLLRPRASGFHPEAAAWKTAVVANGGSVSGTTLSAVDKFCKTIDAAGIRDRFYRLNLFAGTGLSACLVPLYRGPSFAGTQYGNTTDTNNNFVSGDYAETGASGGLAGNGSSKYLNTGLKASEIGVSGHAAIYHRATIANAGAAMVRVSDGVAHIFGLDYSTGVTNMRGFWGSASTAAFGATGGGFHAVTRRSATDLECYRNGSSVGTNTTSVTPTAPAQPFYIFASNQNGSAGIYSAASLQGYSLGLSMTASQVTSYDTAMQTFQTALSRA